MTAVWWFHCRKGIGSYWQYGPGAGYCSAMDITDRTIIALLQDNGRMSVTDLADSIPLSVSATSERLRRILDAGLITGFTANVDPVAVGRTIEAIVDVRFMTGTYNSDLDFSSDALSGVVDALHATGRFDMQLRVLARDVAELDRLLEKLKDEHHAEETNTRLVLRTLEGFPRPLRVH